MNAFCFANGRPTAVSLKLTSSKVMRLLAEQSKFEELPEHRLPFILVMTYIIMAKGTNNEAQLGFACAAANWLNVGRFIAQIIQEFLQDKDDVVMMYIIPNCEEVTHTLTPNNFVFSMSIMAKFAAHLTQKWMRLLSLSWYMTSRRIETIISAWIMTGAQILRAACMSWVLTEDFMQIMNHANVLGQLHHLLL